MDLEFGSVWDDGWSHLVMFLRVLPPDPAALVKLEWAQVMVLTGDRLGRLLLFPTAWFESARRVE